MDSTKNLSKNTLPPQSVSITTNSLPRTNKLAFLDTGLGGILISEAIKQIARNPNEARAVAIGALLGGYLAIKYPSIKQTPDITNSIKNVLISAGIDNLSKFDQALKYGFSLAKRCKNPLSDLVMDSIIATLPKIGMKKIDIEKIFSAANKVAEKQLVSNRTSPGEEGRTRGLKL
jgi:hypothetical protein